MEDDGACVDPFCERWSESIASGGYRCACSAVRESVRRGWGADASGFSVVYDGLRGGSCGGSCGFVLSAAASPAGLGLGFGLGGDSKLMRGGTIADWPLGAKTCCVGVLDESAKPFRSGTGPSSTTQSLRSISDVLRPRLGGDGDGDGRVTIATGLSGMAITGETGVSNMSM